MTTYSNKTDLLCPGDVITINLSTTNGELTNQYRITDAAGNVYSNDGKYSQSSTGYSFQYTVTSKDKGGEIILFNIETVGYSGTTRQCSLIEKLSIWVQPTIKIQMAATPSQVSDMSKLSELSRRLLVLCPSIQ